MSLDWPLSRDEKKSQLLRLYNEDVKAADVMLCSGNKALEALRTELEAVRCAAGVQKTAQKIPDASKLDSPECPGTPPTSATNEVERLRQAVESAAAVLRAILPTQDEDDPVSTAGANESSPSRSRARSEGACRDPTAPALRPALCRTPRQSGRPKRRVSFGSQPEEEPAYDPETSQQRRTCEEGSWNHYGAPPDAGYVGYNSSSRPVASALPPPASGYSWNPPSAHGWGAPQGPAYYNQPFGATTHQQENMDIFVDVAPEVAPSLQRGAAGTFEMYVPSVRVKLSTSCDPLPQHHQDLAPFRPFEEFSVALPEVQRVVFNPWANMPPNGRVWCRAQKRGAVIELPPHITMNARLKTDSPFGSLILEDISTQGDYKHKVGETILNYRLQVDGQLTVGHGKGHLGSNRLVVELNFTFDCYLGGAPVGEPQRIQSQVWPSQGPGYGGPSVPSYSGPAEGTGHTWQPQGYGAPWTGPEHQENAGQASMNRSCSEGRLSWTR